MIQLILLVLLIIAAINPNIMMSKKYMKVATDNEKETLTKYYRGSSIYGIIIIILWIIVDITGEISNHRIKYGIELTNLCGTLKIICGIILAVVFVFAFIKLIPGFKESSRITKELKQRS